MLAVHERFLYRFERNEKMEMCQNIKFRKKKICNARIHSNQFSNLTCSFTRYCQNLSKANNEILKELAAEINELSAQSDFTLPTKELKFQK